MFLVCHQQFHNQLNNQQLYEKSWQTVLVWQNQVQQDHFHTYK